jgi:hypothetical protein
MATIPTPPQVVSYRSQVIALITGITGIGKRISRYVVLFTYLYTTFGEELSNCYTFNIYAMRLSYPLHGGHLEDISVFPGVWYHTGSHYFFCLPLSGAK